MRFIVLLFSLCMAVSVSALELAPTAEEVHPLLPGMKVPGFSMKDVEGREISINPEQLDRPIVLTFYRGGWCPYCNLHLAELRNAENQLKDMGFDVWFVSADRPEILYESLKEKVDYKIYSDASLEVASTFGIAFKLDEGTVERYQGYGLDLEKVSGESHHGLPVPATFIVGTDGIVQFQYTNPDYSVRLAPSILVAAAEAYQQNAHGRMKKK
ncbi:MAG: AhpC/TSA family protein [Xanthomonadales bacterium]|jgi:peroxiredoxin|nr:AhpC/TSA family protein [Xanthomonadales bacterium]